MVLENKYILKSSYHDDIKKYKFLVKDIRMVSKKKERKKRQTRPKLVCTMGHQTTRLHAQNKHFYAYDHTIYHQNWCSELLALSDKLSDPTKAETFHVSCELTLVHSSSSSSSSSSANVATSSRRRMLPLRALGMASMNFTMRTFLCGTTCRSKKLTEEGRR